MKRVFLSFALAVFFVSAIAQTYAPPTVEILTGRYDPKENPAFAKIPIAYTDNSIMYIQYDVLKAFIAMRNAAKRDGINLFVVSATRTFNRQAEIWEGKWDKNCGMRTDRAATILQYSSMPGTSRHHWGTDIDLCSTEDQDWETKKYRKVLAWLEAHAHDYGFFMPYSDDPNRPGYKYEPWHWSYYPIADIYTEKYIQTVCAHDLHGFRGYTAARPLRVIANYVLGIAQH